MTIWEYFHSPYFWVLLVGFAFIMLVYFVMEKMAQREEDDDVEDSKV